MSQGPTKFGSSGARARKKLQLFARSSAEPVKNKSETIKREKERKKNEKEEKANERNQWTYYCDNNFTRFNLWCKVELCKKFPRKIGET